MARRQLAVGGDVGAECREGVYGALEVGLGVGGGELEAEASRAFRNHREAEADDKDTVLFIENSARDGWRERYRRR